MVIANWKEQSRGNWHTEKVSQHAALNDGLETRVKLGCLMRIADALEDANKIAREQISQTKKLDRRLSAIVKLKSGRTKEE